MIKMTSEPEKAERKPANRSSLLKKADASELKILLSDNTDLTIYAYKSISFKELTKLTSCFKRLNLKDQGDTDSVDVDLEKLIEEIPTIWDILVKSNSGDLESSDLEELDSEHVNSIFSALFTHFAEMRKKHTEITQNDELKKK